MKLAKIRTRLALAATLLAGLPVYATTACRYSRLQDEHSGGRCTSGTASTYCYNVAVCSDSATGKTTNEWVACKAVADGTRCPSALDCYRESQKITRQAATLAEPLRPLPTGDRRSGGGR
jgi:hypothetical protein